PGGRVPGAGRPRGDGGGGLMRLHRLRLVNFRQYADSEIVVGPGITGIIGPNGSGKSTLLEAIAWAIYGNPAARGDKEGIGNLGRSRARASAWSSSSGSGRTSIAAGRGCMARRRTRTASSWRTRAPRARPNWNGCRG